MKQSGSITVFFSLILSIILSLVLTLLVSAKVQAGRAIIAMSADQTMYSLMARYDRELFDAYHLFFLDAGYNTSSFQLGNLVNELDKDLSYLLQPNKERALAGGKNYLKLQKEHSAVTGYTLATDENGRVFKEQVVSYMKDTMGIQGVSALLSKLTGQEETIKTQQQRKEQIDTNGSVEDFEQLEEGTEERRAQQEEAGEVTEMDPEDTANALDAAQAMGTVATLKHTSLLNLVLQNPGEVSGWASPTSVNLRERQLHTGFGLAQLTGEADGTVADMLFQEYIVQNFNCFGNQRHETGPKYAIEYILQEKASDIENLEGVVNQLLLMREAANVIHLYSDAGKRAQVQGIATLLSTLILLPEAQPVIEAAMIMAWAFVESLIDVRGLLDGGNVPLIKTAEAWQVNFTDIPKAVGGMDGFRKSTGNMGYEDYLRLLLFVKSDQDKVDGAMTAIEWTMRGIDGKSNFSMDCLLDSLEVEWEITSENKKTFSIVEQRSYRTY